MTYTAYLEKPTANGRYLPWRESRSLALALYGLGTALAGEYRVEDGEGRVVASVTLHEVNGERSPA